MKDLYIALGFDCYDDSCYCYTMNDIKFEEDGNGFGLE